jgi:glc operon protein GlcG
MRIWSRATASSVIALALGAAIASGAQLADKKALTLEVAKQMAAAAEKEAVNNKWTMVVAVVDDGGNLIYLQRMDETQLGSIQVAQEKAKTALQFKRPTKALEDAIAGGRNAVLKLPAMAVEGGLPITVDGKIIGAIGCSGGTSPQDGVVCKAGIDALPKILGH